MIWLGTLALPSQSVLSLSDREGTVYASHDVIEGKRKLQLIGEGAAELSLSLKLHGEWCNPTQERERLRSLRTSGQAFAMVADSGYVFGTYVVTDMSTSVVSTFDDGTPLCLLADLRLADPGEDAEPARPANGVRDEAEDIVTATPTEDTSRPIGTVTPQEIARR